MVAKIYDRLNKKNTHMKIQYNTDKTISGDERHEEFFTSEIGKELDRFESHITRIEAHLSDQNGYKDGKKDIMCTLEARIKGMQPIAVSCQANTTKNAVSGSITKLKASLDTIIGRRQNH